MKWVLMLKGTRPSASSEGGYTIGMSLVVLMLTVATLVPVLEPMNGTPFSKTCLKKLLKLTNWHSVVLLSDHIQEFVLVEAVQKLEGVSSSNEDGLGPGHS